jgi:alkylation response protein AidB-like acyl-CoA dehydrogenase
MFSTRLNPTKPSAAHRAILERVGAACRELRPIEDESCAAGRANPQAESIFQKHRVSGLGIPTENGGVGTDPLLVVMAAERIGREGVRLVRWFAEHAASGESLKRSLYLAAGGIGVIADSLEMTAAYCAERIKNESAGESVAEIELHVALTACDLEATRAITYAAAELKAELDRQPNSSHLQLETGTLISEALLVSLGATARMFDRAKSLMFTGKPLADCLPPRHRLDGAAQLCGGDLAASVTKQIARFYLLE